jgi:hypothetical protein
VASNLTGALIRSSQLTKFSRQGGTAEVDGGCLFADSGIGDHDDPITGGAQLDALHRADDRCRFVQDRGSICRRAWQKQQHQQAEHAQAQNCPEGRRAEGLWRLDLLRP